MKSLLPLRDVQRSSDARGNCLTVCPLPNSSVEACEKYRATAVFQIQIRSNNFISKANPNQKPTV